MMLGASPAPPDAFREPSRSPLRVTATTACGAAKSSTTATPETKARTVEARRRVLDEVRCPFGACWQSHAGIRDGRRGISDDEAGPARVLVAQPPDGVDCVVNRVNRDGLCERAECRRDRVLRAVANGD